jgi:hypothetical protein
VFLSCGGTAIPVFQSSLSSSFRSALVLRPEKAPKNELVFVAGFDGSAKDVFFSFAGRSIRTRVFSGSSASNPYPDARTSRIAATSFSAPRRRVISGRRGAKYAHPTSSAFTVGTRDA